jgi:hypothetical protein
MPNSWITFDGKKILYENYSRQFGGELLNTLYEAEDIIKTLEQPVPILTNFQGANVDNFFLDELIRLSIKYEHLITKSATIGHSGTHLILAEIYLEKTGHYIKNKYFEDALEAKKYLVGDS